MCLTTAMFAGPWPVLSRAKSSRNNTSRRGSKPGHTRSWVGPVRVDDGILTLSAVVRVWTEMLV